LTTPSPLRPALNILFGADVIPGYEAYVRRLATYRKEHASPLDDTALIEQTTQHIQDQDPSMAQELKEGDRMKRQAIQEMFQKYGR
jgi:hypothetical protein